MFPVSSLPPPPLSPHHVAVGEICSDPSVAYGPGLGLFDPTSLITGVVGGVSSFLKSKNELKTAEKIAKLETQKLNAQKQEDARRFAKEQAAALIEPEETKRTITIVALIGVAGIAALVAGGFALAAVKAQRGNHG
jgi:hypothetical protein